MSDDVNESTTGESATAGQVRTVCVNIDGDQVGGGFGRARALAVATVAGGVITAWQDFDVRWDVAHDQGAEGSHHARIVTFMREHGVDTVVTGHMGPPMQNTLAKLGLRVVLGASGDARAAAVAAAAV